MIGVELLLSGKELDSSRSAFKLNYSNRFRRLENRLQLLASFADRSRRLLGPNRTFIANKSIVIYDMTWEASSPSPFACILSGLTRLG